MTESPRINPPGAILVVLSTTVPEEPRDAIAQVMGDDEPDGTAEDGLGQGALLEIQRPVDDVACAVDSVDEPATAGSECQPRTAGAAHQVLVGAGGRHFDRTDGAARPVALDAEEPRDEGLLLRVPTGNRGAEQRTIVEDGTYQAAIGAERDRRNTPSLNARARSIVTVAHEIGGLVRVPAPVLAEVCRGARHDAAINHLLNSRAIIVAELNRAIAQYAGHLLARLKLSSAHAIDAFVVATAAQYPTAIIATGVPADIRRLASRERKVRILAL